MQYEHKITRRIFIELTNQVHGGPGWDFGSCLWSPERSIDNKDVWSAMRHVKPGDLIIHSLKNGNKGHVFVGSSYADSECMITEIEPVSPGRWAGRENYYRIDLRGYKNFVKQIPIKNFLEANSDKLKKYKGSFYTSKLGVAQKYLIEIESEIFELLNYYFEQQGIMLNLDSIDVVDDELKKKLKDNIDNTNEHNEKKYKEFITIRTVRDYKMITDLKSSVNNMCQICGRRIDLPNSKSYSEGHHIKPLNGIHDGPDKVENVIILCPNHHVEFDYGLIAIKPRTNKIIHINKNNEFNNKELAYKRENMGSEYIKYHFDYIFKKL